MEINPETTNQNEKISFQPDQLVSYGSSGICKIISCESCSLHGDDEEETYYKLQPIDGSHSTYYIPVDRANERLRPLLTKDEIYGLIDEMADEKEQKWCDDNRERRGIFQNILHGDDYREIIQMMHAIHLQQERKRSAGRKLAAADEAAMHAAESRMYQEFGIVLNIAPDQVHNFIVKRLAKHTATQ